MLYPCPSAQIFRGRLAARNISLLYGLQEQSEAYLLPNSCSRDYRCQINQSINQSIYFSIKQSINQTSSSCTGAMPPCPHLHCHHYQHWRLHDIKVTFPHARNDAWQLSMDTTDLMDRLPLPYNGTCDQTYRLAEACKSLLAPPPMLEAVLFSTSVTFWSCASSFSSIP